MKPAISIIVPVYKVADYIADCIRSIAVQTFRDFELILVDDCSPDESVDVAKKVLGDYDNLPPVIWLHHDHNKGLSCARNSGLEIAQGEYVLFIDSDDWIMSDCLEKLHNMAKQTEADVIIGNFVMNMNEPIHSLKNENRVVLEESDILQMYYDEPLLFVVAWNKLVRKNLLKSNSIKFIEGLIHEDEPWSFEVAVVSKRYAILDSVTYHYRVHPNTLSTDNNFMPHYISHYHIINYLNNIAKKYKIDQDTQFHNWIEKRKATFFRYTEQQGNKRQLWDLYRQIRRVNPSREFNKKTVHYFFPVFLGFYIYNRFYKHYLA